MFTALLTFDSTQIEVYVCSLKHANFPRGCELSNPVPLPDLSFDSFSYPVASTAFGDMAIESLFLLLFC